MTGCSGECCFRVMYGEWYGVSDFVVLSVVEVCADYGGVNVFHVCINFDVVYGVVVCGLFLMSGCCLLCCVVGVWCVMMFVLSVMHVVGGVPLWVECVFCHVYVVCVPVVHPVAILSAVFCVICSLLMFVSDASGDHMVETYSSMGLVMDLYVAMIVSCCFPHVVDVSA